MFQMFRCQPTQKSTSSERDCLDSPLDEARLGTSVSSDAAIDSDATRGESDLPAADAAIQQRLTSAVAGTDDSAVADMRAAEEHESDERFAQNLSAADPSAAERSAELAGCDEQAVVDVAADASVTAGDEFAAGEKPEETDADFDGSLERLAQAAPLPRPRRRRGRQLVKKEDVKRISCTPEQRLLLLDTWRRSGLPAKDFAALVGLSKHTLYKWKQLFEQFGPAGLTDQPRGSRGGSRLPDLTRRTILMLKEAHPEWGCQRISDMLARGPALPAGASAVARVLHEAGYETVEAATHPHPDKVRRFERARPNQLWQTDLFTFVLKRQNRRVYLVAFLDDHSRFLVSYGLHATASTALVLEALEAGLAAYGPPEEILTDNGPQYVTWRGKSQFTKHLEKRGIRQIVARPRRPQTLGKIERFWGTLWREFLEAAVFVDLADARTRIGHFIDDYNFHRVHRGIDGLVPADRFFGAASDVSRTLRERVAANALELARHGAPRKPFYVTGQVDGQAFSVHAEGERLILRREDQTREEITLAGSAAPAAVEPTGLPAPVCPQAAPASADGEPAVLPPPAPGTSALDEFEAAGEALRACEGDSHEAQSDPIDEQREEGGAR
jgi:transposase InsO family protein